MQSWVKLRKDAVWGEPDSTKKHQNQPIVVRTKQYQNVKTRLSLPAWELARNQNIANSDNSTIANRELAKAN